MATENVAVSGNVATTIPVVVTLPVGIMRGTSHAVDAVGLPGLHDVAIGHRNAAKHSCDAVVAGQYLNGKVGEAFRAGSKSRRSKQKALPVLNTNLIVLPLCARSIATSASSVICTIGVACSAGAASIVVIGMMTGTAGNFAVLGGSTITNTGATRLAGALGVSPGTTITGFPPGIIIGTRHSADSVALQAQHDAAVAYGNVAARTCQVDLTGQDLGGQTLTPGVYCFTSSAQLTGHLILDSQGKPASTFFFQIGSALTTASNANVSLINSAQACNVFWQAGSSVTVGANTHFRGNILALTSITFDTGAISNGSLYARNGIVTLDTNTITQSPCTNGISTLAASSVRCRIGVACSTGDWGLIISG